MSTTERPVPEPPVPLLILDLDGTVREGKDDPLGRFVNGPQDVRVFPEAVVMMRRWKAGGGRIIAAARDALPALLDALDAADRAAAATKGSPA